MPETSPLDFLNPTTEYLDKEKSMDRLRICHKCPSLRFKICQECGCFMTAKVRLVKAECPIGKW